MHRILLVETHQKFGTAVQTALQSRGDEVVLAKTGDEAVQLLGGASSKFSFDIVVVLDLCGKPKKDAHPDEGYVYDDANHAYAPVLRHIYDASNSSSLIPTFMVSNRPHGVAQEGEPAQATKLYGNVMGRGTLIFSGPRGDYGDNNQEPVEVIVGKDSSEHDFNYINQRYVILRRRI